MKLTFYSILFFYFYRSVLIEPFNCSISASICQRMNIWQCYSKVHFSLFNCLPEEYEKNKIMSKLNHYFSKRSNWRANEIPNAPPGSEFEHLVLFKRMNDSPVRIWQYSVDLSLICLNRYKFDISKGKWKLNWISFRVFKTSSTQRETAFGKSPGAVKTNWKCKLNDLRLRSHWWIDHCVGVCMRGWQIDIRNIWLLITLETFDQKT